MIFRVSSPVASERKRAPLGSLSVGRQATSRILKNVHPLPVASGDLRDGRLARGPVRPPVDQRVPPGRAAHGEADESVDAGRRRQPGAYLPAVLTPAQDDAT